MRWMIAITALLLAAALAGCAANPNWMQRSAAYQPNAAGIYPSSGTAAGWEDLYGNGFGYANPMTDPGPAGAAYR
jgi:hypothetical protein